MEQTVLWVTERGEPCMPLTPTKGGAHQGALRTGYGVSACPEDGRCPSVAQKQADRGPGDRHTCF